MATATRTNRLVRGEAPEQASRIVLQISDYSAWPEVDPNIDLIVLTGELQSWVLSSPEALLQSVAMLPAGPTLSLQIELTETRENTAAFDCILKVQRGFFDRAFIDIALGQGDTHYVHTEAERGRAAFFSETASFFLVQGAPVRWLIPLTPELVYKLETFFSEAQHLGVEPMIASLDMDGLDQNDLLFAADFVRHGVLEKEGGLLRAGQRQGYEALLKILDGGNAQNIDSIFSKLLSVKPQAARNERAPKRLDFLWDAAGVLFDGARAQLVRALALGRRQNKAVVSARFEKVLLIGAYGGEHIGDAAILGGVMFRLHARHGVKKAILMSQRPAHTRHLIPMIETPVDIVVREYLHREIDACVDEVDAVVFAGGPIVDLPKQLVRHLYTVSRAKALGKPFLMEGVGPGPLHRLPSKLTAHQVVDLADYISVRTRESADAEIVKELDIDVGRDPAFDYLETRQGELSKTAPKELIELEHLLDGVNDRPIIGVNIRPIYHQYTVGVKAEDKAAYTQMAEDRFECRLAEALTEFCRKNPRKPIIVFFPMNAVQFGLSDLKSAWRIARHMGDDVDYRVWEADVSLDGVLALIRRLDIAVTMRFHATIFALSQGIETIGVDYRIGKRDKVAAVLSDAGKGDQCARIDEMTVDWLTGQLERLSGASDKIKTG